MQGNVSSQYNELLYCGYNRYNYFPGLPSYKTFVNVKILVIAQRYYSTGVKQNFFFFKLPSKIN